MANGATTLWESWRGGDNGPSHNHPMFGSVSEWFYRSVLGINPAPDAVGCDRWELTPQLTEQIRQAEGAYHSVRGTVRSAYTNSDSGLEWRVEVPANTRATLAIPLQNRESAEVKIDGQVVWADGKTQPSESGKFVSSPSDALVLEVGSGRHVVTVKHK